MSFEVAVVILSLATIAAASEYGVSSYRPGLMDLYAGLLPPPGTLMVKDLFLFQDASASVVSEGPRIEFNAHTKSYTDAVFAAYVTKWRVLGSNWTIATIQMARIATQSIAVGPHGGPLTHQASTVGGPGDGLFIPAMLNWNWGQFHLVSAFTIYAPTGTYSPDRIISIGLNRWAFEPDVGVTWMNDTGQEFSLFTGYTMNTTNNADGYHSGDEFHTDFAAVQHLRSGFLFGLSGYALQQTTGDGGSGAILGPFKGRVIALGPIIGRTIALAKLRINVTAKYDIEFAEQNRSSGNELWPTAALRF